MNVFDPYIFHLLVFSPLLASIFIILIPRADISSKLSVSRFFSAVIFAIFFRCILVYANGALPPETKLSFQFINLNIQISFSLNKYNVFLFGIAAATLLANMALYAIKSTKTNIHQTAPFVLTFLLFICFGQSDLKIALPILSFANFLLYFLISTGEKIRRGSTIFQMGIFIFFCDALALILLQIPSSIAAKSVILLLPGFTRMLLPMAAPFARKLIINMDDTEGPFLVSFLQLSGFYILVLAINSLPPMSFDTLMVISGISLIGALYIALTAINNPSKRNLPYYFLIFYASLASFILCLSKDIGSYHLALTLFATNIACFLYSSQIARVAGFNVFGHDFWRFSLILYVGLPGVGVGTPFLAILYSPIHWPYLIYASIFWILGMLMLSAAMMRSNSGFEHAKHKDRTVSTLIAFLFTLLLSWLIAMVILYKSNKGL